MFLKQLDLLNFRNFDKLSLSFNKDINLIYGINGLGKTNILEAIQCSSLGRSLRASSEMELVNEKLITSDTSSTIITSARTTYIDNSIEQENIFTLGIELTNGKKIKKSKSLINNKKKYSLNFFLGNLTSLWFSPESIRILQSSPTIKRDYLDQILLQFYPSFHNILKQHNRILAQKSKMFKERVISNSELSILKNWNEKLIKLAIEITSSRILFINQINSLFSKIMFDSQRYSYQINFNNKYLNLDKFDTDTEDNIKKKVASSYLPLSYKLFKDELLYRSILFSSRYDEWTLYFRKNNSKRTLSTKSFASRGEQRMALIYLQFILIKFFEEKKGSRPVMLLDDIFSELDQENIKLLIKLLHQHKVQAIITGVKKYNLGKEHFLNYINIEDILNT